MFINQTYITLIKEYGNLCRNISEGGLVMGKLMMKSKDILRGNLEKIEKLFPNVIVEIEDENGGITKAVDFSQLQQELCNEIINEDIERYLLTWPGKKEAIISANTPINKTLRPVVIDSLNWETTENIYIEGDNFDVLKLLQESYLNKIKCIYIDPPYNTGNDLIYKDKFVQDKYLYTVRSGQVDSEGNQLFQNTEYNGRYHSDWLTMMYPRLKLARNLLTEDGVIFISIDDNEVHNLRRICDEIFGEVNFINCFIWNCSTAGGIRPRFASKTHEYILCYARNIENVDKFDAPLSSAAIKLYNKKDSKSRYREKDFVFKNPSTNENQRYVIECPDGQKVRPKEGYIYRFIPSTFKKALKNDMVVFKKTSSGPLVDENGKQARWNIYIKKYLGDGTGAPSTLIPKEMVSIYNAGTSSLQKLFDGCRVFPNSKPIDLITYLIQMVSKGDDIILDFFSGAATTAHAVMDLNAKDGLKRKYIMVQLQEPCDKKSEPYKVGFKNIAEIGKERIRRAGKNIKEETDADIDYGFRVFKVDKSNMKDVYYSPNDLNQDLVEQLESNIKEDRTGLDLLTQVMLHMGLELSLSINTKIICGKEVHFVKENSIIACFDESVDECLVNEIAKFKPLKVVFRDSSFNACPDRINIEKMFNDVSPNTEIKVL